MNKLRYIALLLLFGIPVLLFGQVGGVLITGNIYTDLDGGMIGVSVLEMDKTDRAVSATTTDFSGNFSLQIKNTNNKLRITYVGFKTITLPIGSQRRFDLKLEENTTLTEVIIMAQAVHNDGTFSIPKREISGAVQRINTEDFKGLSVASIDDALQGRIAGLDIVGASGNLGSGSTLRIRGTSSLNSKAEPLIVVNDVPFENNIRSIDLSNATEEQFANLLNINPDDIEEITVLKDGASAAIWGSRGANGVISIRTKKGAKGPTRVQYSYRFSGKQQPTGVPMLNGDDYTMMMKQAYFNPRQNEQASILPEFSYDPNFWEYENFNNNTNWVDALTQYGFDHDHNITVSGGGDKATFRMSVGYLSQTGTVIKQSLDRLTSRMNFEYRVSERIRFTPEISVTYINNHQNLAYEYGDDYNTNNLLAIAYRKMPNVPIYRQDAFGNNTGQFYAMPLSRQQSIYNDNDIPLLDDAQRRLSNPVAYAYLGMNNNVNLRVTPKLSLLYDFLEPGGKAMLRYKGYISFDYNSETERRFYPQELFPEDWNDPTMINRSYAADKEALTVYSDQNITYSPDWGEDHSLLLYASWQLETVQNQYQEIGKSGLASSAITDPTLPGQYRWFGNGAEERRSMGLLGRIHYAYMKRYILDMSIKRDGDTRFGPNNRWGNFPGISAKWILSDESFMESSHSWLSELGLRMAYGITGNSPDKNYLHFSRYNGSGTYIDISAIRPVSVKLSNLKWETSTSYNGGFDLSLFNFRYNIDFNVYKKRTEGLLLKDLSIPTSTGFSSLAFVNAGIIDNDGWELNVNTQNMIKVNNWTFDVNFNLANNANQFVSLDPTFARSYNKDFAYTNGADYLSRIQEGNALGSIYGFRYKGVYQWDKYEDARQNGGTSPYAKDAEGNVILDGNGNPTPMTFAYGTTSVYTFRGGDAIYEDINHDGTIDELDIVYLGNSNPKLNGGFGATLRYKNFSMNAFFNFRYGNKILNQARRNLENMYTNNNQSIAVNWRWRKDGDVTEIPRALYNFGYNTLPSDRFVEDGSYLRFKYLTFMYNVDKDLLKPLGLKQLDIYLTLNDIYTFTKYTGVEPEIMQNMSQSDGLVGVSFDKNRTPRAQYFTLGITAGF